MYTTKKPLLCLWKRKCGRGFVIVAFVFSWVKQFFFLSRLAYKSQFLFKFAGVNMGQSEKPVARNDARIFMARCI